MKVGAEYHEYLDSRSPRHQLVQTKRSEMGSLQTKRTAEAYMKITRRTFIFPTSLLRRQAEAGQYPCLQNEIITLLPLISERETSVPPLSGSLKSGTSEPRRRSVLKVKSACAAAASVSGGMAGGKGHVWRFTCQTFRQTLRLADRKEPAIFIFIFQLCR